MVARDRDEGGVARRGSRRPRDEDEKYTTRERRQGRTKKKVCKACAAERDGDARFQSERVRETARRFRKAGWVTRGVRTHRLKNLDLYLDLSKERVVRHVEGWVAGDGSPGGRGRARSRWRTHTEGARRYANVNFTIKVAD